MIAPTMTVAEVLERHPETLEVFRHFGFGALSNPFLRRTFAHLVTVAQACARHGVAPEPFLAALNAVAQGGAPAAAAPVPACAPGRPCGAPPLDPEAGGGPVHAAMNIAEAVRRFPETRPVFSRFFGNGCFTCPSFGAESVRFACGMHGADPAAFVNACNRAVAEAREPGLESLTLNEILRRHPESSRILHRYGLDACCGGGKTLATAAAAHSLNLQDLAAELRAAMPPADPGAAQPAPASFAV
jgi:hypothetical protein